MIRIFQSKIQELVERFIIGPVLKNWSILPIIKLMRIFAYRNIK